MSTISIGAQHPKCEKDTPEDKGLTDNMEQQLQDAREQNFSDDEIYYTSKEYKALSQRELENSPFYEVRKDEDEELKRYVYNSQISLISFNKNYHLTLAQAVVELSDKIHLYFSKINKKKFEYADDDICLFLVKMLFSGKLDVCFRSSTGRYHIVESKNIKASYEKFCASMGSNFFNLKFDSVLFNSMDTCALSNIGSVCTFSKGHFAFTIDPNFTPVSFGFNIDTIFKRDVYFDDIKSEESVNANGVCIYSSCDIIIPCIIDKKGIIKNLPFPKSFLEIASYFVEDEYIIDRIDELFVLFLAAHFKDEIQNIILLPLQKIFKDTTGSINNKVTNYKFKYGSINLTCFIFHNFYIEKTSFENKLQRLPGSFERYIDNRPNPCCFKCEIENINTQEERTVFINKRDKLLEECKESWNNFKTDDLVGHYYREYVLLYCEQKKGTTALRAFKKMLKSKIADKNEKKLDISTELIFEKKIKGSSEYTNMKNGVNAFALSNQLPILPELNNYPPERKKALKKEAIPTPK